MIKLRSSFKSVFTLLFLICSAAQAQQPNILFISVDDLRPELGCYGANHMHTPNIDALASAGVRFDGAYCQQAVCLPSRISLFTGMRPDSTGVHDLNTKFRDTIPDVVTLTQHLGKSGYRTIGSGKVYHDEQPKEWDKWIDTKKIRRSEYHLPEITGSIEKRIALAKEKGLKGKKLRQAIKGPSCEAADFPDEEFTDAVMTDFAIDQLKEKSDQPFFMTVGYHKPHLPFVAPKKYWDLYERKDIDLPGNYFLPKGSPQLAQSTWGELRSYSDIPSEGPVSNDKALELIHGYYASVSFVDAQVGRLMAALKKEGLDKNTVVILWSDHGWKLGEHAMWCKHTNFEIDARVPLIFRMPNGESAGQVSKKLVELIDIYPTVCELAGIKTPESCEGKSLFSILNGEQKTGIESDFAMSQYKRSRRKGGDIIGYSIKIPEGRFTDWVNQDTGVSQAREFYDHSTDSQENSNAIDQLSPARIESYSTLIRERSK